MTQAAVAHSTEADSQKAGTSIGEEIVSAVGTAPGVVVLFASPQHDFATLLTAIQNRCSPVLLLGCSSAGEFSTGSQAEGSVSALALKSDSMSFSATMAGQLSSDRAAAAATLVAAFRGVGDHSYPYHYALVLADALAGYTDELIEHLTRLTGGSYHFFGGGAGDDARFGRTYVFLGTDVVDDAAVALEILSHKPLGIGVRHGWRPAGAPMRVTEAEGVRLGSLNAVPAADVMAEYAEQTGQAFRRDDPVPFFLHNVLGVKAGDEYKLRVPLAAQADGSLLCASDTPEGATVRIMETDTPSASNAASAATADALRQLNGAKPEVAVFFDCVATRLRTGREFGQELDAVQRVLGSVPMVGCNTYGQIARADGQFNGFHNCTAVVCLIPE
jgi:hypothetical protein